MKNIHEYIIQLFFLNRNIYVQLVEKQGKGQDAEACPVERLGGIRDYWTVAVAGHAVAEQDDPVGKLSVAFDVSVIDLFTALISNFRDHNQETPFRPGKVNSATPDLSYSPNPSSTIRSY